jgi:hypothetical protein
LNQHNPLYNSKVNKTRTPVCEGDGNEEIKKKLIFDLHSLAIHEENFRKDCIKAEEHINSFVKFSIAHGNIRNKLKWYFGNNLFALETKPTQNKTS